MHYLASNKLIIMIISHSKTYRSFLGFSVLFYSLRELHWFSYEHCDSLLWKVKFCRLSYNVTTEG